MTLNGRLTVTTAVACVLTSTVLLPLFTNTLWFIIGTGAVIAVAATGAYCRSLASNYNHLPRPGVVAVADGAAREIVRRETLDDLLRLDVG